jgi:hypothetical protein
VPIHDPDRATLVVHVTAGPRSTIASLPTISGTSPLTREEVLARLGLAVGSHSGCARCSWRKRSSRQLRSQGFYTADVQHQAQFSTTAQVDLELTVEAGPKCGWWWRASCRANWKTSSPSIAKGPSTPICSMRAATPSRRR